MGLVTNWTWVGGISKGYAAYWLKCFTAIAKFHGDKQLQLSLSVINHPILVLKSMTAASGSKCWCHTIVEESNNSGDSSQSTKKSRVLGIGEGKPTVQGKKATSGISLNLTYLVNFSLACFF